MPESLPHEETDVTGILTKTDWKGIAMLVAALTGALGFVWNKVELYFQNDRTSTNEVATEGAYDTVATRLDELFFKIEILEKTNRVETHYTPPDTVKDEPLEVVPIPELPPKAKMKAKAKPQPKPSSAPAMPIEKPSDPKQQHVSKRFERARLPEFKAVQKAAADDKADKFIQEVRGK